MAATPAVIKCVSHKVCVTWRWSTYSEMCLSVQ